MLNPDERQKLSRAVALLNEVVEAHMRDVTAKELGLVSEAIRDINIVAKYLESHTERNAA